MDKELPSELSHLITRQQSEIFSLLNFELISMFWKIGGILNTSLTNPQSERQAKSTIKFWSKELRLSFGPYFSASNLSAMTKLNRRFPEFEPLKTIALLVGWEQIKLLMEKDDEYEFRKYLCITIDEGLTANALKREIGLKAEHGEKTAKCGKVILNKSLDKYQDGLLQLGFDRQNKGILAIPYLFKSKAFQMLMRTRNDLHPPLTHRNHPNAESVLQLIDEFVLAQHIKLNASLNRLFWQTGKLINESLSRKDGSADDHVIQQAGKVLTSMFGKNFDQEYINEFSLFQGKIPNYQYAVRLIYLLPFKHILALLQLESIELMYYYARTAARNGLSVDALQKRIRENERPPSAADLEKERELISKIDNPSKTNFSKHTGNAVLTITTNNVNYGDDLEKSHVIGDIYKNEYFIATIG